MRRLGILPREIGEAAPTADKVSPKQLAALAFAFGPSAAGWLTWSFRKKLRLMGAVDFELPDGKPLPLWFAVAMECLKKRSRKWRVEVHRRAAGGAKYRLIWRGKQHDNMG